ncbi:unnamed protein product [Lactuca virosa]|uniref:DUF4283 domain-containing protein n=1 Tax=Lactuca virosa TaxID=75947 RepID=A0AAU9P165_9ASTR|nr:unnamed protein product [Lactuca virosa]
MLGKFGSIFGLKSNDPPDPDPDCQRLYEEDFDVEPGAIRRGRRAIHKENSPYTGDKPLLLKEKIKAQVNRNLVEKKFLESKSSNEGLKYTLRAGVREVIESGYGKENSDPNFIKSELKSMENAIKGGKGIETQFSVQAGFNSSNSLKDVPNPSIVLPGNEASKAKGILGMKPMSSEQKLSSQSVPVKIVSSPASGLSPVKSVSPSIGVPVIAKSVLNSVNNFDAEMNDSVIEGSMLNGEIGSISKMQQGGNPMNEDMNLDGSNGNNLKVEQGSSFLNLKWDKEPMNVDNFSKPSMSPAAKLVSDYNKKSYARMVESTSSVVDLNIKVIPKADGKPAGKVELPYADLMLGGAPYHATLYGFFMGKKLAFPTINHFAFKMWKIFGLKDIMVNDEGFFFFKFDSKEGMMSVLEGGPWLINNVPLFIQRWRPGLVLSKPQIKSVHVWVKVFNVPLEYWNSKGVTLIANEIGKPIAMDNITQKMCKEHWGRPAFMRFLVEMSAEFNWLKEISVVSIDFGTCEKVESSLEIETKEDEKLVAEENSKNGKVDSDVFILVTKKNNKGKQSSSNVVFQENRKIDLIKSLEKSTVPMEECVVVEKQGQESGRRGQPR